MGRLFLGLGSNLGTKEDNINTALIELKKLSFQITKVSKWYFTSPWGNLSQDDFLNIVLEVRTHLHPITLLYQVKLIEMKMGRLMSHKWGPRKIDIDLLAYDDLVMNTNYLQIPHPYLHLRNFVLKPWIDVAPDFYLSTHKKNIIQLYEQSYDRSIVYEWKNNCCSI